MLATLVAGAMVAVGYVRRDARPTSFDGVRSRELATPIVAARESVPVFLPAPETLANPLLPHHRDRDADLAPRSREVLDRADAPVADVIGAFELEVCRCHHVDCIHRVNAAFTQPIAAAPLGGIAARDLPTLLEAASACITRAMTEGALAETSREGRRAP